MYSTIPTGVPRNKSGVVWRVEADVRNVHQPEVHVLLDVNAQVLDVSNHDLAQEWLKLTGTAGAAGLFPKEWRIDGSHEKREQPTLDGTIAVPTTRPLCHISGRCSREGYGPYISKRVSGCRHTGAQGHEGSPRARYNLCVAA